MRDAVTKTLGLPRGRLSSWKTSHQALGGLTELEVTMFWCELGPSGGLLDMTLAPSACARVDPVQFLEPSCRLLTWVNQEELARVESETPHGPRVGLFGPKGQKVARVVAG